MAMDYLDRLGRFASALEFAALPAPVREQAAWVLADTLAAIVAGAAEPELRALAASIAPDVEPGGRADGSPGVRPGATATLAGLGRGTSADLAALINGTAGTFLEVDEGNRYSRGHPAIHVLPAVLALCEEAGLGADALLAGFVAGYEVGSRFGAASRLRGTMHPHGTWGTLGAAAGCARALATDAAAMRETISIAASMTTATSKRTMLEGGLVRNVYAGLANRNGLLAARMAGCGFTGERDGPGSLFAGIVSEHFDRDAVVHDLGQDWHLLSNYFKRHTCCRYNHGTLDALDLLAARGELVAAGDVAQVVVETYDHAAELNDPAPRNTLAAKFSVPFAVATRLVHGSSALDSFAWPAVRDPAVLALAARVTVREDPAMSARLPRERPARVTVTDRGGRSAVAEVGVNRGDDALPYGRDELRDKFLALCARIWPVGHARALLDATLALAEAPAGAAGREAFDGWRRLLRRAPDADSRRPAAAGPAPAEPLPGT